MPVAGPCSVHTQLPFSPAACKAAVLRDCQPGGWEARAGRLALASLLMSVGPSSLTWELGQVLLAHRAQV